MVKQVLCSMAFVAGLIPFLGGSIAAQEVPKSKISDYFLVRPSPPVMSENLPKPEVATPTPPAYCNPCLFYGGDFDPSNPLADGLWNAVSYTAFSPPVSGEVLVPFTVPAKTLWFVEGLFTNNLSTVGVIDPKEANWSISTGVAPGIGGTIVKSGTAPATFTPTGRSYSGFTEYTVMVQTPAILLVPGTYWMTVVPLCTNVADSKCTNAEYYLSDVEDTPPLNAYGPLEPNDLSYFESAFFGATYYAAASWCEGIGCDRFSAGVIGK